MYPHYIYPKSVFLILTRLPTTWRSCSNSNFAFIAWSGAQNSEPLASLSYVNAGAQQAKGISQGVGVLVLKMWSMYQKHCHHAEVAWVRNSEGSDHSIQSQNQNKARAQEIQFKEVPIFCDMKAQGGYLTVCLSYVLWFLQSLWQALLGSLMHAGV